jgi:dCMP deaminase
MDTARLWSARSTCSRLHVGCVIARDSRILTTGYNGTPSGMPHCNHECDCNPSFIMSLAEAHHKKHCNSLQFCTTAVHAEANAITFAARYGLSLEGAFLYTTHMPCLNCCMLIVNSGVEAVVWETDYRDRSGLELLEAGKVGFGKYRPQAL